MCVCIGALRVKLQNMEQVHAFCNAAGKIAADIDLRQGRYVVDAKSILGILSLNLHQSMLLDSYGAEPDELRIAFAPFIDS